MLKLAAVGLWVILVTAGATFGAVYLSAQPNASGGADQGLGLEELKSEMTSIPVLRDGAVQGYLIVQLSFAADRGLLAALETDPLPFMQDAAFRTVFSSSSVDFQRLRPDDIDRLTAAIAREANARLGAEVVKHVLLQQVNFVRKEDIRTNWISGGNDGN